MIVEVVGASVRVGGLIVLPPVTFTARSGEIVALRGANGSGKTTLLRVLAGALRPTGGTVTLDGRPPAERDPAFRRRVGALIGFPPFARNLTLVEHIRLVRASWGSPTAHTATEELLAGFELDGLESRFPHELSSGQTQLFALALTLARPSDLLLLDEPEQRLDPERTGFVAQRLLERAAAGTAIVMSTHSDALVEGARGRVVPLAKARHDSA